MNQKRRAAKLVLSDGRVFEGFQMGSPGNISGEAVFTTGMVGYVETLTDPSYSGQILCFTYPLIGNYGVPEKEYENGVLKNFESGRIQVSGLVVSELSEDYSHYSAGKSLEDWMIENGIPGISGVDTRALTKHLREYGTMPAKIIAGDGPEPDFINPGSIFPAYSLSIKEPVIYEKGPIKIALVDCGVKNSIIQAFLKRNLTVLRVPLDYDFNDLDVQGVVISNGPGDPKSCTKTIANVRKAISKSRPLLGICLGCQILGLAAGADTYKLKYGHRGQNQPCNESGRKRCYITSQNHGYAISADTLPQDWIEWFQNDNDGTNEGIMHISKPLFGAQFHPEASPGPDDTEFIFDMFLRAIS